MQIAFKEKVSEYIIYAIKLKIANWITASSPHISYLQPRQLKWAEIKHFNLSILKSTIYNWEMLTDSFLTLLRALPHSHMYPATSGNQSELSSCNITSSLQPQIGQGVFLLRCGDLELESIYKGGNIDVVHGKLVWCSLYRTVMPPNVYLFIKDTFTALEINEQNLKWTRQVKLKVVSSPHILEFLSLPTLISKKKIWGHKL